MAQIGEEGAAAVVTASVGSRKRREGDGFGGDDQAVARDVSDSELEQLCVVVRGAEIQTER